jgi:hypothetical protein
MARIGPESEIRLMPNFSRENDVADLVHEMGYAPFNLPILDSYQPWQSVSVQEISTQYGAVIKITDSYLPPAQREGGELYSLNTLPGGTSDFRRHCGYEGAAPSSVLFTSEFDSQVLHDSIRKPGEFWLRRMGVKEMTHDGACRPWLEMKNGNLFVFSGVSYDTSTSRGYGAFSKKELTEMGYACVLLNPHIDTFFARMQKDDHIWIRTEVGKSKALGLFVVRKNGRSEYSVITSANELVPIMLEDLKPVRRSDYEPTPHGNKVSRLTQRGYTSGRFGPYGWGEAIDAAKFLSGVKENKILEFLPSVVIEFAGSKDSFTYNR